MFNRSRCVHFQPTHSFQFEIVTARVRMYGREAGLFEANSFCGDVDACRGGAESGISEAAETQWNVQIIE
jgi:hypothetical protein